MLRNYLRSMCDHLDVRVRDFAKARVFYDAFCPTVGLTEIHVDADGWAIYRTPDETDIFLTVSADSSVSGSLTRIALRADSPADVDRIAAVARSAGATDFEGPQFCPEYGEGYYASFFCDPSGNRLEICHRKVSPTIARLWTAPVKPGVLAEYAQYAASTGLADYLQTPGNRGAVIMAERPPGNSIITLSFWKSLQAIEAFSTPIDRARYYPEDDKYLVEKPQGVKHFDVTF